MMMKPLFKCHKILVHYSTKKGETSASSESQTQKTMNIKKFQGC